jgi:hypothetical protein
MWPAALLALAPKCLLCVLAYGGLGAAIGIGAPELCGAPAAAPASWAASLAWLGVAGGLIAFGFRANGHRDARLESSGRGVHFQVTGPIRKQPDH